MSKIKHLKSTKFVRCSKVLYFLSCPCNPYMICSIAYFINVLNSAKKSVTKHSCIPVLDCITGNYSNDVFYYIYKYIYKPLLKRGYIIKKLYSFETIKYCSRKEYFQIINYRISGGIKKCKN